MSESLNISLTMEKQLDQYGEVGPLVNVIVMVLIIVIGLILFGTVIELT